MAKIGIIAGQGKLPLIWAQEAKKQGHEICAFNLIEEKTLSLQNVVDQIYSINIGKLDELINLLLNNNIEETVMLGKVEKTHLFSGLELDNRMKRLLAGLKVLNDDSILLAIVEELESSGIEVLSQTTYLKQLLPETGVLTSVEPDDDLIEDMRFGFEMAQEIGRLDIGQTVIVKNKAVLAVEAIEGTDQAIKRGGKLGNKGITMAKVSKPQQDFRFDVPTVGLDTLNNLIEVGARGLVIEAGKTFLLEKQEFLKKADMADITVMAMN